MFVAHWRRVAPNGQGQVEFHFPVMAFTASEHDLDSIHDFLAYFLGLVLSPRKASPEALRILR